MPAPHDGNNWKQALASRLLAHIDAIMARESFIFDPVTSTLIPKGEFRVRQHIPARGDFPLPMLQRDSIEPGVCQIDGKVYDSKSALHRAYGEYEARTGHRLSVVADSDIKDFTTETPQVADEKAIETSIKTALERHSV